MICMKVGNKWKNDNKYQSWVWMLTCSQHGEKHGENGKKHNNESTQQVTMPKLEWFWQH
jgi:hypothetical protein